MTQEKLERRAWKFVAADKSRIPVTVMRTSIEWCLSELEKAAEIAKKEADGFDVDAAKFERTSPIHTSLAKRGDVARGIEQRIRKLME